MGSKSSFRITVASVEQSRYDRMPEGGRPLNWDDRKEGIDVVRTDSGETLRLYSEGQQSVPQKGWVLMVTGGDNKQGHRWTLYGMPKGAVVAQE